MSNPQHDHNIGMFDSGVGGLTIMLQVTKKLPKESIVYFGDTARLPYGSKSPDTIIRYSVEIARFLIKKNIKILIVACSTASSCAVDEIRKISNVPVAGVIEPGAAKACQLTQNKRIAVLGTKATINSGIYEKEIHKHLENAVVFPVACPLFVPIVEEHFVHHSAAAAIVKEYLQPLKNSKVDTILLGCTHYPLLRHLIQEEMGEEVRLVDPGESCAEMLAELLQTHNLESSATVEPRHEYYVSDDCEKFRHLGKSFLGREIHSVHLESWQ